jgi:hypothetical protein
MAHRTRQVAQPCAACRHAHPARTTYKTVLTVSPRVARSRSRWALCQAMGPPCQPVTQRTATNTDTTASTTRPATTRDLCLLCAGATLPDIEPGNPARCDTYEED